MGQDSSTATTDCRVLALVRRIWSLRGLPLMPVGKSDSDQIEMAQRPLLSHPFASIQADP
jgi:hypothetical protein